MAGKNKGILSCESDSENYYDDEEDAGSEYDLDLPLEKLNLGPKKKLLVLNLNGLLVFRIHRSKKIPLKRLPDTRYGSYLGIV